MTMGISLFDYDAKYITTQLVYALSTGTNNNRMKNPGFYE